MNQLNHYEVLEKFASKDPLRSKLYFVLSGVEYPDNIGHFIRISASLGIDRIMLHNCKLTNKSLNVGRDVSVQIIELISLENYVRESNDKFYAVEITSSSIDYKLLQLQSHYPQSIGLVMGGEKNGIQESILELIGDHVHVPMYGKNSSMNVSHAGAIVAYEIASQLT